ncbi:TPA: hypothetical protein I6192_003397 [Vibrio cholerae]|nr:hypothetical protein [Vibrio cholerae]
MAAFGGYPQNVTFSTVNVAKGGGSENLLINPRGKINQLNEPDGVLSAGVYFCDGWKAGASGAEVYRDSDGFRLISGSIVQLVPNNLGAGRNLRANMDIISGSPVMSINGFSDNAVSSDSEYISLEISGNNSKFNRLILAESLEIPIYQQSPDELTPCLKFAEVCRATLISNSVDKGDVSYFRVIFKAIKNKTPAVIHAGNDLTVLSGGTKVSTVLPDGFYVYKETSDSASNRVGGTFIVDARP